MTDHPCNCETCKTFDVTDEMDSCPFESVCGEFGMTITPGILSFIKIVGCLSHPLALQVLAAPVIAELERQHADLIDIELHTPESHNDVVNDSYKADGIQISINILKGGA